LCSAVLDPNSVPYPEAQDFYERSLKIWPEEGFEDLFRDDFIRASSHVARRKLDQMETGPYQRALLRRGITTKVDVEDERNPVLQQAMEYVGAVGTMVMDELAYVHERTETGLGMAINRIEREVTRVDEAVVEHTTLIAEVQGDIKNLIARDRGRLNVKDALRMEVMGLRHLVSQLLHRVTALEGHQEHPIEVEDSSEEEESDDEDEAPVPVLAPGVVYQLVPIEDLEEEEEDEDEEIEEGLAIEIAALDPALAYTE